MSARSPAFTNIEQAVDEVRMFDYCDLSTLLSLFLIFKGL